MSDNNYEWVVHKDRTEATQYRHGDEWGPQCKLCDDKDMRILEKLKKLVESKQNVILDNNQLSTLHTWTAYLWIIAWELRTNLHKFDQEQSCHFFF